MREGGAEVRNDFDGMLRVVRFNWPLYAAATLVVLALLLLVAQPVFAGVQAVFLLSSILVLLQTLLSLLASHWVYDRSALRDWRFLLDLVSEQPLCIVNVHSGYDETSGALHQLFAKADIATVDLYPALGRREPSIVRARKLYPPVAKSICETISDWPLSDSSVDFILIAFAAHEVRDPEQRELLFRQAHRVLKPAGRIVLVEHVRDFSNFVAFSFGFMHFLPLAEWIRCVGKSNLKIAKQYRITPLVAVLELCR
ncbi:MAG: hypothetical protein C0508_15635 [Cyanobacteria bacterium PR.023]|nr:hypothetical protein [Cyanobacteria bacterium PR.023]